MASIFADNVDAVRSQGSDRPERLALGFNRIVGIAGDKESAETAYADVELTKNLAG